MVETVPVGLRKQLFSIKTKPNLNDYDALGFAVDHCLVQFNEKQMV
jgi:hypothetical protein